MNPILKDDPNLKSKVKLRQSTHILQQNDDLKSLWTACYFERKLSKPMIQAIDLKHTLTIIQALMTSENIDFRTVAPLILGLSKIFQKRVSYLLSESTSTLDQLKHPFTDEEQKDQVAYRGGRGDGKKSAKRNPQYQIRGAKLFSMQNLQMPGLQDENIKKLVDAMNKDLEHFKEQQDILVKQEEPSHHGAPIPAEIRNEPNQDVSMAGHDVSGLLDKSLFDFNRDQFQEMRAERDNLNETFNNLNLSNDVVNLTNKLMEDNYAFLNQDLNFGDEEHDDNQNLGDHMMENFNDINFEENFFGQNEQENDGGSALNVKKIKKSQKQLQQIQKMMMKKDKNISKGKEAKLKDQIKDNGVGEQEQDMIDQMNKMIFGDNLQQNLFEKSFLSLDTSDSTLLCGMNQKEEPQKKVLSLDKILNPGVYEFLNQSKNMSFQDMMRSASKKKDNLGEDGLIQDNFFDDNMNFEFQDNNEIDMGQIPLSAQKLDQTLDLGGEAITSDKEFKKRSLETLQKIKPLFQDDYTQEFSQVMSKVKEGASKQDCVSLFMDMLFLNQNGDIEMEQEPKQEEFSTIKISMKS